MSNSKYSLLPAFFSQKRADWRNPNPDKQASGESGLEGGLPEHRDDHPLSALNREPMGENLSEVEVALQAKPHKDRKTKKKRIQADEVRRQSVLLLIAVFGARGRSDIVRSILSSYATRSRHGA